MISKIITKDTITVLLNHIPKTIGKSHLNYDRIKELLKNSKTTEEQLEKLINIKVTIEKAMKEFKNIIFEIKNGSCYINDKVVDNSITKRILYMISEGYDIEPMKKFIINTTFF